MNTTNLNEKMFSKHEAHLKKQNGEIILGAIYSYESKKKLYDVLVIKNEKQVQVDMKGFSKKIEDWRPFHYAIVKYFNL